MTQKSPGAAGKAPPAHSVSETRLQVFVHTELVNRLNRPTTTFGGRMGEVKRARKQREAVALAVWVALHEPGTGRWRWTIEQAPTDPKRITLTAHVARKFDSDGLAASLKAVRDGLQDARLIHDDGPDSGHRFAYAQVIDGQRGVTIRVERA